jgi:hypothetical protein
MLIASPPAMTERDVADAPKTDISKPIAEPYGPSAKA